jgi:hypothetical protein
MVMKGIVSKQEKAVPLSKIQDTSLTRSIVSGGSIVLSSAGGTLSIQAVGPLTRANAQVFADAVNQRIHAGVGL